MLTIKKQAYGIAVLAAGAAACFLLSGCEPQASRALHHGDDLIKKGHYEDAVSSLREAIGLLAHDPPAVQARAWNLLGLAYQDIPQADNARKCYAQALKLDRNLSAADYNLGCLELEEKHYAQAMDYFTTYTNVRPRDVVGYTKLGSARLRYALQMPNPLEKRRQLDEARRVYEIAQSLAFTPEACNGLGMIELEHRSPPTAASVKAAEKLFATAFQYDPKFAPAILNQGIVCDEYLNDHKTALIKYKEYLLLETNAPNARQVAAAAHEIDEELRISVVPEVAVRQHETLSPSTNQTAAGTVPPKPKVSSQPSPPAPTLPSPQLPKPTQPLATQPAPEPGIPPRAANSKEPLIAAPIHPSSPAAVDTAPPAHPQTQTPPVTNNETAAVQPESQPTNSSTAELAANAGRSAPVEAAEPSNAIGDTGSLRPEPPPRKEGFVLNLFKRLNPANWFNGKDKKPSAGGAPSATETAASPASTGAQPDAAPGGHYSPPALSVLTRGNRADAMKLVAQAAEATRESRQSEALQILRDAVKADPTCYEACFALGMACIDGRDYSAALEALYQALLIREDSADARYAYAWALDRKRYCQDAAGELEKLVAQHAGEVRAHLLLGNIYSRELDQPKQARQQYAAVLALDPTNSQAAALRAWLHDNVGQ